MIKTLRRLYSSLGRYRTLYLISALELIAIVAWSLHSGMGLRHFDSSTYYVAYNAIIAGYFPITRTPLYPMLIGITKSLFGHTVSLAIVLIFQSFLFLCSIKWLGKALDRISNNNKVSFWFTAIYALYPGMLSLCGYILTESLAVSMMSALVYLVSEAYYRNSYKKAASSGILCLFLWLLRPALIYVPVIMLVFWCGLLLFKKHMRKTAFYGCCLTLFSVVALGAYMMMFYKEFNKVGITCVTTLNNYLTIREAQAIDIAEIESPQLKDAVDSMLQTNKLSRAIAYREYGQLSTQFGLAEIDRFINRQIKRHPKEILFYMLVNRREILLNDSCVATGAGLPTGVYLSLTLFKVNNGTAFLIFLTALLFLICADFKNKQMSYFLWLLVLLFIANYFSIWVAAPDDFTRLSAPNYPVLLSICCLLLNQLIAKAQHISNKSKV